MNKKIMRAMGFEKEMENVAKGLCPFCNKPIVTADFRDARSLKEYTITGLCQNCQDKTYR
jgi:hypothetical protein